MSKHLLSHNWIVVGLDAMTDYYDVNLKINRHKNLKSQKYFHSYEGNIEDIKLLDKVYEKHKPDIIVHLAAQAGVRYSIENPMSYVQSNLIGTFQILEMARKYNINHLLIASTSSVYGDNKVMPFNERQKTDTPMSFYAATKKSNEVMAHSYSHLFEIPTTIFRFFTVYGPWGRPDMALFKFTKNILAGKPIDIYNYGNMKRDFTYIDDLTEAIRLLIDVKPLSPSKRKKNIKFDNISDTGPYRIVNIGNSKEVNLLSYIEELEKNLGIKAKKNFLGMQEGDVEATLSDINLLKTLTGFSPKKKLKQGIIEFVDWYKSYYS